MTSARLAQRGALRVHQLAHARLGQIQQPVQLAAGIALALTGALHLHVAHLAPGVPGHDHVHVHLGAAVLGIFQIQHTLAVHHAHGHRRHLTHDGRIHQHAVVEELVHGQTQRRERAGDGRGARAAVGLNHVAVDVDRALAQPGQVARGAERAADEPLNLHAAPVLLHAVPGLALGRGSGQHGVFRREPSGALALQERRNALLHRRGADHPRPAALHQHRAGRHFRVIRDQSNLSERVRRARRVFHKISTAFRILKQVSRPESSPTGSEWNRRRWCPPRS